MTSLGLKTNKILKKILQCDSRFSMCSIKFHLRKLLWELSTSENDWTMQQPHAWPTFLVASHWSYDWSIGFIHAFPGGTPEDSFSTHTHTFGRFWLLLDEATECKNSKFLTPDATCRDTCPVGSALSFWRCLCREEQQGLVVSNTDFSRHFDLFSTSEDRSGI